MKESYGERLATHTGPESCGVARKGDVEAWTGERTGRIFTRLSELLRDADSVETGRSPSSVVISRNERSKFPF